MQNITISNHSLYIVLTRQLLLWKGSDLHSSITLLTTSVGFLYSTSSIPFGITAHQEWDGCRYRPYITENTGVGSTVGSIVAGIDSLQWTTVRQKKKKGQSASRLPLWRHPSQWPRKFKICDSSLSLLLLLHKKYISFQMHKSVKWKYSFIAITCYRNLPPPLINLTSQSRVK